LSTPAATSSSAAPSPPAARRASNRARAVEVAQTQALITTSGRGVALSGDGRSLWFLGIAYLRVELATVLTSVAGLHLAATAKPVVEAFLGMLPPAH
jgi:hypothetical protein